MEPPAAYVDPTPGPHEGTCLAGMPGNDKNDVDYIHLDDADYVTICGVVGCDRLCAPNITNATHCVALVTWATEWDIVFWQHELRCLPVHGTQPVRMRLRHAGYGIINNLD